MNDKNETSGTSAPTTAEERATEHAGVMAKKAAYFVIRWTVEGTMHEAPVEGLRIWSAMAKDDEGRELWASVVDGLARYMTVDGKKSVVSEGEAYPPALLVEEPHADAFAGLLRASLMQNGLGDREVEIRWTTFGEMTAAQSTRLKEAAHALHDANACGCGASKGVN